MINGDTQNIPLTFIVGSPRSGTNMLHGFLDAHPETVITTEFPFIPLYAPLFANRNSWTEKDIDEYVYNIQKNIRYRFWSIERWHIDMFGLRNRLIALIPEGLNYPIACRETILRFKSVFPKSSPKVLIQKEPIYSLETKKLLQLFPEANFVYIHRDPRAQVNSVRKMPFGSRLLTANTFYWNRIQKHLNRRSAKKPDCFYRMSYEELVQNTELELRKLCGFLKIEFTQGMLNYTSYSNELRLQYGLNDEEILKYGESSFRAPDVALIDSWKKELKPREIKIIESGCRKQMVALGYERVFKGFSLHFVRYLPVWIHALLQRCIGKMIGILPFSWRVKIIFSPSLFEATYGRLFGRRN